MSTMLTRPRLGFLGIGWIGLNRMEAFVASGIGDVAAVADADEERARSVAAANTCVHGTSVEDLVAAGATAIVIATPSSLHAEQAIAALDAGLPVFCQKPLARNAAEAEAVVAAARRSDLLLGVDMSYREVRAFQAARRAIVERRDDVYALDLQFHNAYGPDKPWFTDPVLSGGGCVIDLGTHLLDLAAWWLGRADLQVLDARLYHQGRLLRGTPAVAEDHAEVLLAAEDLVVRLACSWFLALGVDASIRCSAHAPRFRVEAANVGGSFYDFEARRHDGRTTTVLARPPDDWGGRALCSWASRLGAGEGFDATVEDQVAVAATIDTIYGRTP